MKKNNILKLNIRTVKAVIPKGFFDTTAIKSFWSLIDYIPINGTIVESGSCIGRSICSIGSYIRYKNLKVFCIEIEDECIPELKLNINKHGLQNNITVFHENSLKVAERFNNKSVDLIFFDSEHSYDHLSNEIKCWKSKMKNDSIMSGHDYNIDIYPGVVKAVKEAFNYSINMTPQSKWSIWKSYTKDLKI